MVYRDAVKVILHRMGRVGSDAPVTNENLLTYIQEAFELSQERHDALLKKERNEEVLEGCVGVLCRFET